MCTQFSSMLYIYVDYIHPIDMFGCSQTKSSSILQRGGAYNCVAMQIIPRYMILSRWRWFERTILDDGQRNCNVVAVGARALFAIDKAGHYIGHVKAYTTYVTFDLRLRRVMQRASYIASRVKWSVLLLYARSIRLSIYTPTNIDICLLYSFFMSTNTLNHLR